MPENDAQVSLTVPQVADRLSMTNDGAYKLIQRGHLGNIEILGRKTTVPEEQLEAYIARLQARVDQYRAAAEANDPREIAERFTQHTGCSPADWVKRWERRELEDTAENMALLVQATSIINALA